MDLKCSKAKCLNYVSKGFLMVALFEYTLVCANVYLNPAFNLGQVGAADKELNGLTADEVYKLYTAIPDERTKRLTHWSLVFVRVGAIMQSALGFAYGWALFTLPFHKRYPFHFIYTYVAFMMSHIDFSYGNGMELGTDTLGKFGYQAQAFRLNNMPFMIFLLVVHVTLGILSLLEKKSMGKKLSVVPDPIP